MGIAVLVSPKSVLIGLMKEVLLPSLPLVITTDLEQGALPTIVPVIYLQGLLNTLILNPSLTSGAGDAWM